VSVVQPEYTQQSDDTTTQYTELNDNNDNNPDEFDFTLDLNLA
jgi:hypothetical protein